MDKIAAMRLFVSVVEHGGFSAAAAHMKLPLATVSRQIAALERELGARLLARTTRRVAPTESGRAYHARAKRILDEVDEAEALVADSASALAGRIVVSGPILLGHHYLVGAVGEFMAAHPRVEIDLWLSDRFVSLVEEGVDVAVRVGLLADSGLVARKLAEFRHRLVASPAYLAARGTPEEPDDLAAHECILSIRQNQAGRWQLTRDGEERVAVVRGRFRTDVAEGALRAAMSGLGIARVPEWALREALAAGALREVLPAWRQPATPIHAVYSDARLLSARVRRFVDFLAERAAAAALSAIR